MHFVSTTPTTEHTSEALLTSHVFCFAPRPQVLTAGILSPGPASTCLSAEVIGEVSAFNLKVGQARLFWTRSPLLQLVADFVLKLIGLFGWRQGALAAQPNNFLNKTSDIPRP